MMFNNIKTYIDPNDPDKLIVDFTFQPVQPVSYVSVSATFDYKRTWQDYLRKIQLNYDSWFILGQEHPGDGLPDATEMMQEKYPGPYRVVKKFDPDRETFGLVLEFDDPKEETLWRLKWS